MSTPLMNQACYSSAMGNLDWLDTSYSPLQLIEKYKLPMLVRICEGYYGNTNNSCFSAMDVIKMHEIQRVDMVLAKVADGGGSKYPDAPDPVRVCFPKGFAGRFDPIHQSGSKPAPRRFHGVRRLAELAPHFVRVKKRPAKKGEGPDKDDVLEILGLTMCEAWWEDRGFLRCRNQDGEEVMMSLKWSSGTFEAIPDPEGYTLQDLLKRFVLPCKVTLRDPSKHLYPESDLQRFLPKLEDTLVLEREITHEFLVGTAADAGASGWLAGKQSSGPGGWARNRSAQHPTPAVPWVVLTKNANVLFQICQDMVHKRAAYISLLEMFGGCCMDNIPLELFICEYAAPLVAFARTEEPVPPSTEDVGNELMRRGTARPPLSRSAPDLSLGAVERDEDREDSGFCGQLRVNPEVEKRMHQRELPPLPPAAAIPAALCHIFGTLPSNLRDHATRETPQNLHVVCPSKLASAAVNEGYEEGVADYESYTTPTEALAASLLGGASGSSSSSSSDRPSSGHAYSQMPDPSSVLPSPPSSAHPDPPPGFSPQRGSHAQVDEVRSGVRHPESGDAPPTRKPPPPPRRTTPTREEPGAGQVYGNIEPSEPKVSSEAATPNSTTPNSTTPRPTTPNSTPVPNESSAAATPGQASPSTLPGRSAARKSPRKQLLSHSFSTADDIPRSKDPSPRRPWPGTPGVPWRDRPASMAPGSADYLKPRRWVAEGNDLTASSRSRSTGTLLEEAELSDPPSLRSASKGPEASESGPARPVTPCKPTRRITQVRHIPDDIESLTTAELAQCFRLLRLGEAAAARLRDRQINGSLLSRLTLRALRTELELTDFQAEKVEAFRSGWRPDGEA